MNTDLNGKKIAILVENGFELVEMTAPRQALDDAGAKTDLISPVEKKVKSWDHTKWGRSFKVNVPLAEAHADEYDALLLPGGVMNPDKLRINQQAVDFVKKFIDAGKPIAAICHGPWTLIETGAVRGRKMTSWPSIKTDLRNAGAEWVDEDVVVDDGLVTSRKPEDIPAFNHRMIEEFRGGVAHEKQPEFVGHADGG
jgi:protease I